ncbi:MAG: ATP-binding cassette domain-containing protein [Clostridia bacterium]|nr:ATP-binding cassette domain-containing protein [Clostridia bacterium]
MIELSHIVKRFGDKLAVDDVSFAVGEGEIVGFLGPNGAGKTTTLSILTGYLSATSGTAKIGGVDILEHPAEAKRQIGFLPEYAPLYLDMTVEEYLGFVYELKGVKLPRAAHLCEIAAVARVEDVYRRVIKNLSKGYRQRVGIAAALVGNPKILVFDEPTVGLDPAQIVEIRNLIRTLGRDHTIILSTHILSEVQAVCDRIVVIDGGKILADKSTAEFVEITQAPTRLNLRIEGEQADVLRFLRSFNGVKSAEALARAEEGVYTYFVQTAEGKDIRRDLFFALAEHDFPVLGMEALGMSVEDIFLRLVGGDDNRKEVR